MADLIGQHLGQYEILSNLGEGGMATVYRARQATMKRDVAIKIIKHNLEDKAEFVMRFEREAQTAASLSHPFILKVFDFGAQEQLVYLVMELLTGGSLADLIEKGPLSIDTSARTLDQIASALDYAHQKGIIHRDFKPQNVLLDEQANAHLADFGLVKLLTEGSNLTQAGNIMGTPTYIAPEQWRGKPIDARADVYALGVTLFEMLNGRLPFVSDTPLGLMHMHMYEAPPPLALLRPDLPDGLQEVINKALAKNPDQRFQSAGALSSAFRSALALSSPRYAVRRQLTGDDTIRPSLPSPAPNAIAINVPPSNTAQDRAVPESTPTPVNQGTPETVTAPPSGPIRESTPPPLPPSAPTLQPAPPPRSRQSGVIAAVIAVVVIAAFVSLFALRSANGNNATTPTAIAAVASLPPSDTVMPTLLGPVVLAATAESTETSVASSTALPLSATPLLPSATASPEPPSVTAVPPTVSVAVQASTDTSTIATVTSTPHATETSMLTATITASVAKEVAIAATVAPSPTDTVQPTSTAIPPTSTSTATYTDTPSPVPPTATASSTPAATDTVQPTSTAIPPTSTSTATYTSTASPVPPTATASSTPAATDTVQPTSTAILPTATLAPTSADATDVPTVTKNSQWTPQVQSMNGVDMALVPPGCFKIGLTASDIASFSQQPNAPDFSASQPQTQVCFDKAFWIDANLVTNQQFAQFKGKAAHAGHSTGAQRPRDSINWFEARDFCALRGARLPTEAEWEYAARGPDDLAYPWGNSFVAANAVYPGNSNGQSADVGSKPAGKAWVGALDMAGNALEWTSSIARQYPYNANDGRESASDTTSSRVLRGGAWNNNASLLRSSYRFFVNPYGTYVYIGFRCVRS